MKKKYKNINNLLNDQLIRNYKRLELKLKKIVKKLIF